LHCSDECAFDFARDSFFLFLLCAVVARIRIHNEFKEGSTEGYDATNCTICSFLLSSFHSFPLSSQLSLTFFPVFDRTKSSDGCRQYVSFALLLLLFLTFCVFFVLFLAETTSADHAIRANHHAYRRRHYRAISFLLIAIGLLPLFLFILVCLLVGIR
jgi:hypothetical protein